MIFEWANGLFPSRPATVAHNVTININPSEILLVASHKYDLKAARECGFKTAYIFRPTEFQTLREDQCPRENEFDFVTTEISKLPAMLNADDVSSLTSSFRRVLHGKLA